METLPDELTMEIISFLPLKSLLILRGVNTYWRNIVLISNIHPIRRVLLELFYSLIADREFLRWRRTTATVQERRRFLKILRNDSTFKEVPDEFCAWAMEWPEKVAFGWVWERLALDYCYNGELENPLTIVRVS